MELARRTGPKVGRGGGENDVGRRNVIEGRNEDSCWRYVLREEDEELDSTTAKRKGKKREVGWQFAPKPHLEVPRSALVS